MQTCSPLAARVVRMSTVGIRAGGKCPVACTDARPLGSDCEFRVCCESRKHRDFIVHSFRVKEPHAGSSIGQGKARERPPRPGSRAAALLGAARRSPSCVDHWRTVRHVEALPPPLKRPCQIRRVAFAGCHGPESVSPATNRNRVVGRSRPSRDLRCTWACFACSQRAFCPLLLVGEAVRHCQPLCRGTGDLSLVPGGRTVRRGKTSGIAS